MRKNLKILKLKNDLELLKKDYENGNLEKSLNKAKKLIEDYLSLKGVTYEDNFSFVKEADFFKIIDSMEDWMKILNGDLTKINLNEKIEFTIKRFEEIINN